jgi:ligand-binding SRPBCC domain-containing protein
MKATMSTLLDANPERVWTELQRPELLVYVAAPLVVVEPVEPESFPEQWDEGEYRVAMRLFGLIPLGEQTIRTSKVRVDDADGGQFYQLRDDGTGQLVSVWDHLISIRETPDGKTVYTDEIEVNAGVLTPVIWLFAALFYRHRQRRWRKLVANDFEY